MSLALRCRLRNTIISVTDVRDLAYTMKEAFYIARTGRPGPVLVDVPKDVQIAETEFLYPEAEIVFAGLVIRHRPQGEHEVEAALELIAEGGAPYYPRRARHHDVPARWAKCGNWRNERRFQSR